MDSTRRSQSPLNEVLLHYSTVHATKPFHNNKPTDMMKLCYCTTMVKNKKRQTELLSSHQCFVVLILLVATIAATAAAVLGIFSQWYFWCRRHNPFPLVSATVSKYIAQARLQSTSSCHVGVRSRHVDYSKTVLKKSPKNTSGEPFERGACRVLFAVDSVRGPITNHESAQAMVEIRTSLSVS